MVSVRFIAFVVAAAAAGVVAAHGVRLAESTPEALGARTGAALALVAAGAAFGAAVYRLAGRNRVVACAAAALFTAHPAFVGLGATEGDPLLRAPWTAFCGAALVFAGAALRRVPFAAAPPFRADRRRRAEVILYACGAACAPGLAFAPVVLVAVDFWFHPDAPAAWRRSTLRTAAAATALALGGAALGVARSGGAFGGGVEAFAAATAAALGTVRPGAAALAPYFAVAAALLPAGVLARPAASPKALPLALGVAGFGLTATGLAAAVFGASPPLLGVGGGALALALVAWRAASALTTPDADGETAPIPSVPALRDVLAAVDHERGPLAAPGFASAEVAATIENAVRQAVAEAVETLREAAPAAARPDVARPGPDRREPLDDPETAWRRYVRDALAPRLGAARSLLVVGEPPPCATEALAERLRVVRLPEPAADGAAPRPAPCDAVLSFRGHELGDVGAVVRHVAELRRFARRGGVVGVVTLTATDAPAPPAWDEPAEAPR